MKWLNSIKDLVDMNLSKLWKLVMDREARVTVAIFTLTKRWMKYKYPLRDAWIKKMQYIHTVEYCSAIYKKKKEIWSYAIIWIHFKDTVK